MKLIIRAAAILMLVAVTGCDKGDKADEPLEAVDSGLLKKQREALEQAKQVDQLVQDAAEQQRQKIEEETK